MVKEAAIFITKNDREQLRNLIEVARERGNGTDGEYLNKLEEELDRAKSIKPQNVPPDLITMRSKVRLKDLSTGKKVVYALVFPTEANFEYDLIITDNDLPGVNGLDLIRQARLLDHYRNTPIIMLSASPCEAEARRAGADVFLKKPEGINVLVKTAAQLLKIDARGH